MPIGPSGAGLVSSTRRGVMATNTPGGRADVSVDNGPIVATLSKTLAPTPVTETAANMPTVTMVAAATRASIPPREIVFVAITSLSSRPEPGTPLPPIDAVDRFL